MKYLFTVSLLFLTGFLIAQSPIGHTTITFNDASRTGGFGSGGGPGRQIQSEIYYPATVAGEDVPSAAGNFPVVVFGHGFVMSWDAYENIWEELVPQGFILVFPRTEGGLSPDHNEFGLDLAHCVVETQNLNTDAGSIFFTHVLGKSAIMGHSMGGGATFLAAANNSTIETIVGLAPAETTPSAITAAGLVSVPALVMSGSSDGVTPPASHHFPIYYGLDVVCKHFISITGGAHCYFANSNFNCDFGESTSSTGITVTRPDQHQIMFDYVSDWLAYKLKGDCSAWANFTSSLPTDSRITFQDSCVMTSPTITAAGPTTFCVGESVTLNASTSLDWSTGTAGTSVSIDSSGSYYAYNPSTCEVSNAINVVANPNPVIGVSQINEELTAIQSGATYQWVDCSLSFQAIPGDTGQVFTAGVNGNYAVIIDLNGCTDTSACYNVTSLSLANAGTINFSMYPVPTNGELKIESSKIASFILFDITGKVVGRHQILAGSNQVNLNVSQGAYIWKTIVEGYAVRSGKLIVE